MWCSRCKNTFAGAGNFEIIAEKCWCEYLWGPYVLFLDPVFCIVLVSSEIEATEEIEEIILGADYRKKY